MELRQLKYFTVLAAELSFSRAAQKLCITQGTLSQQIKQLEAEIGAELFERNSHSVVLTEAGAELLRFAEQTLEAAHECSKVAMDLSKGLTGSLSIGVTHSFKYLLRSTVKDFVRKYPGIKLTLNYDTATHMFDTLKERKLDFFVAFKPRDPIPEIESIPLFDSHMEVIMRKGHPLADKKIITKEEFMRQEIAMPATGLQSRKAVECYLGFNPSMMNVALETNDPNILLEIVSATNMLSITSTLAIDYRDDLVSVPMEGVNYRMTGCIHRLRDVYVKRSALLFEKMLLESADIERICAMQ